MLVKVFFFGKDPGQGQIPGLLGHGSKIQDRTIDHCTLGWSGYLKNTFSQNAGVLKPWYWSQ
jgi:hypothetical protein